MAGAQRLLSTLKVGISMYDLLMRVPLLAWVLLCAIAQWEGLVQYMDVMNRPPLDYVYAIHIAMRLSTIGFLLLVAAAVVLRTRPSNKANGLEPRISALAGTFMMYSIALFPRPELSTSLEFASTVLILIGSVGAVVTLSQLGRSFSLMAEARQLVTSGPYRFVRHPLYLTEEIATIGLFIQFASVWTVLLLAVHIAFQLRRIHNEETILTGNFPQYVAYARITSRLIPGIY
jgi:protein-S-isoprenylcysteine O-methyltransferase Ste14